MKHVHSTFWHVELFARFWEFARCSMVLISAKFNRREQQLTEHGGNLKKSEQNALIGRARHPHFAAQLMC
jgi:hypothetical protein